MDQIRINATPNRVVVSPTAPRIKIRLATGPQGPAGPPAEVYVQQTQPPTPQNAGAIWYETDANGNIQAEHVWNGSAWLPTPTATGISTIVPVAPITASGASVVSVGINLASETEPGAVARMATAGDVATAQPGPAVDAAVLKSVLPVNTSDLTNDGDGVGGPFVDATDAGNAAPIQSLIAGNNIDITNVGRDFTISAITVPQHQSDWLITDTAAPGYIKNKPTLISTWVNDSGYITAADVGPNAPVQSVNGMTGAVIIDLSPYATNADLAVTNAKFADYLPLAGGAISGGLTVAGAFNVGPAGTARVPTVAATDASTAVATTEWVQTLLAATGAIRFMWKYGGDTVNVDPGLGNLDINIGNTIIAISKTDGHGNQRYLDPIATGDTIVITDDPPTGPATEYQRFDVVGTPTDNGNWVSIPVSLAGGTSPTRVVGTPMRVTIGLDSQVATIDGVSAGYGLTGGGVSGVVTLAIDTAVVAELSDIPIKVSELANDVGYINTTQAADAAPVQDIIAGTDVSVTKNPDRSYTISALHTPEHQSDWAETNNATPAYIKNKPTLISAWTNDVGYITAAQAPVQSVNSKTGVVVLNATDVGAATPADIPTHTSNLTNDGNGTGGPYIDQADLSTELADYLPLAGGTMTGSLVVPDGTAAAPAVKFDDATGIYQPAANSFSISTAGVERVRVASSGWVGIGTNPSYVLHVNGAIATTTGDVYVLGGGVRVTRSSNPFILFTEGASGVGQFRASSSQLRMTDSTGASVFFALDTGSGNVGIGTNHTSPASTLDVNGVITVAAGSAAAPAVVASGDANTGVYFPAADTFAISTGGTERLRVRADGNVGIGNAGSTNVALWLSAPTTGAGEHIGFVCAPTISVDSTVINSIWVEPTTNGTVDTVRGIRILPHGGTGTTKNSHGILIDPTFNVGTVTNYGIISTIPSTAPGAWNLWINGTAPNYFAGNVGIGSGRALPASALDVNGVITVSAGTAAAPAIVSPGSPGSGLLFPAANTVAISTAGVERVRVGATGQITAAAGYTPTAGQDLATKAYVDTAAVDLTNVPDGTAAAPAIAFANGTGNGLFKETGTDCVCVAVGGLKRFEIDATGDAYFGGWLGVAVPDDVTAALDVNGESIRIRQSVTPANATATGEAGEIMWDANYLYVCVSTNTWKRVALSSW